MHRSISQDYDLVLTRPSATQSVPKMSNPILSSSKPLFWRADHALVWTLSALRGGVLGLIEVHELRARRRLQGELIVPDRLIDHQLLNGQPDRVLLLRTVDLNHSRKADAVVVPINLIGSVGSDLACGVVIDLLVGDEVYALE